MTNIIETIKGNSSLSKLMSSLEKAGLIEKLKGAGPYTLFAPTNEAFTRMNIDAMLNDPKELSETLTYHIGSGKHTAETISSMETIGTEFGKSLTVVIEEGETMVDNAKFVTTNIECANGIVHIVDNVFKPMLSGWYREE
ncbi:MAG: fasciclin domain-containing protein [Geobacteraceae bacterium]